MSDATMVYRPQMSEGLILDDPLVTIFDFDGFLDSQDDARPWELVAGRIIGMANPTQRHEQIVANVDTALKQVADKRRCQTFFGGMRVQRSSNSAAVDKPRPHLLVRCGTIQNQDYVTDPLVIVEVLSPSMMDVDRGEKLRFYKHLPTLVHIVLLYQDQQRAEHYRRIDTGWETIVLTQPVDLLEFDALGTALRLGDAYAGL